jgi:hypothetical protein
MLHPRRLPHRPQAFVLDGGSRLLLHLIVIATAVSALAVALAG